MVFKRMLRAFGVGGPSVDTVLSNPNTRPGLTLAGQVNITGGDHDVEIDQITVALVTRVEMETSDEEYDGTVEFHRVPICGELRLAAGQQLSLPFEVDVPWETPVTDVYGQRLPGMTMGLRTKIWVRGALDPGDLDDVHVYPLPVQERILAAFAALGLPFTGADLEHGKLAGLPQTMPFYQEIEYASAPQYPGVNQIELTFLADPHGVTVVLEFDKKSGLFTPGHDSYGHYRVEHAAADSVDWVGQVDSWLRQSLEQRHTLLGGYGGHGDHGDHGSGMGGMLAGAAGGAIAGFAAGMVAEEVFDAFGGDEEE
ncbi:sporulation protein [Solwaraspora sp. WMMB335]|uniref:sporulation protein n=1 Tax=Solwaraspora sp. WMMB335 TaxID=3404118 RepID=UPI003B924D3D